jgi:hypothetical protein
MLPERDRQLLTAFVDGELTSRQRRLVERLLRRSAEARDLLGKLQEDSRHLHNLSVPRLGRDLSAPVLGAISSQRLSPRLTPVSPSAHFPAWAGFAAAALLVGLGLTSFLYFSSSLHHGPAPVAKHDLTPLDHPVQPGTSPKMNAAPRGSAVPGPKARPLETPRGDSPPAVPKGPGTPPAPPVESRPQQDEQRDKDVFTDRMEVFQMDQVEFSLPLLFKVQSLDQDVARAQLAAELHKHRDFRLELPCRAGTRALERLQAACKGMGISLVIDPAAQERIKAPQLAASYAIYIENISPEEWARLVQRAGQEDRKLAGRKPLEIQFDRLVLTRMTPRDRKELVVLMGVDPTQSPAPPSRLPGDPRQPLPDLTAQQVEKSLAGQGGTPRPEPRKSTGRPAEHTGLVVLFNPARLHPGSAEIRHYIEGRKPARPGTLRVLLVLRG